MVSNVLVYGFDIKIIEGENTNMKEFALKHPKMTGLMLYLAAETAVRITQVVVAGVVMVNRPKVIFVDFSTDNDNKKIDNTGE